MGKSGDSIVHSKEKARIAIFFWEGYLGVAPSLINAVRVLSEYGYLVDVITRCNPWSYSAPPNFSENVRILKCRPISLWMNKWSSSSTDAGTTAKPKSVQVLKFLVRGFKKPLRKLYRWGCSLGLVDHLQFAVLGLRSMKGYHYNCFIGVDTNGLIIATLVGALKRTPVLYWSLELSFLSELRNPVKRLLKNMEKFCNRRSVLTITQDWERANSLTAENKITSSNIIIVPNGPLGSPRVTKSNYLQQKFGLVPSCRIILHIGMLCSGVFSLELAEVAAGWPNEWVLIFHERAKRDSSDPYIKRIQQVGKERVLLSLDPVPYDELDNIVCSAHIGVALYRRDIRSDFAHIGSSSGKLGHYLRCGLPVVCIDLPSLSEVINKYQCGICVKDVREIREAMQNIFKNYNLYSSNAVRCYNEVYEFGAHFKQVIRQIEHLSDR